MSQYHHPSPEQADPGPIPCEDAAANNDHHRTIAGNDSSVARIPIEMYRRRSTHPNQQGHQHVDADGIRNTFQDTDRDPQYTRRTHLVELCFHSDFDPQPDTPSSLHFSNDNVVTHWRAPHLPEIPLLRPPNYLVEYDTLRLYPDDRQLYARAAALVAANVSLVTRREWLYLSLLFVLFIALLLNPVPYGHRPDRHNDAGIQFSPNFSSISLPYDVYDMVMLRCAIPVGLLGIRLQDPDNDIAAGSKHRAFPGPPGMDPTAFSSLSEAAQYYAILKASSRRKHIGDLYYLFYEANDLTQDILYYIERHSLQNKGEDQPQLLSYSSFRQLGDALRDHLNEARDLWWRVEWDAKPPTALVLAPARIIHAALMIIPTASGQSSARNGRRIRPLSQRVREEQECRRLLASYNCSTCFASS
ncbi:hypothetical protein VSDG_10185 [Cytospora chrysosperma]|uniref:Uncharacterized protein n=1 Tax=Cytospora chrysosperma TaxID=252740 RepID=A0A423V873_CYTCH|nr:hypothetical protein VSDG_10185 [Valsa sordida]